VPSPHEALGDVVRAESGLIVGTLVREVGDFALAEDAVQDAILEALQHWPETGVPQRPSAWLITTARRRAINRLKRDANYLRKLETLGRGVASDDAPEMNTIDDRLPLIFICCHPALKREAQVALTLRSVLGMTTAQLAKAFLTTDATMTKRITRAKQKIVDAGIPFKVPSRSEISQRLREVLAVVYVMFSEGYLSTGPGAAQRAELASDAEWLASLILQLMPDEPEVIGLLALLRLHQARRRARFDSHGHLVLLQHQDRALWDHPTITESIGLLNRAMRQGRPGPYQVQAAIAAYHSLATSWNKTDWSRIVALYDILTTFGDSPVAKLNQAIAVRHRDGSAAALEAVDRLAVRLSGYHLFHATRAELLRDLERNAEALEENRIAMRLTRNPAELHLLHERLEGLIA
jgi:RNA polymerase sigma-70 factor (ECF subfamily)